MKDEYGGKSIFKFVGPKSKKSKVNNNEENTNKGTILLQNFTSLKIHYFKKKLLDIK